MPITLHPFFSALIVSALVQGRLLVYAWKWRANSAAIRFGTVMACMLIWTFGFFMELASPDLAEKLFWANVQFAGIAFLPLAWLAMVAEYVGQWRQWRQILRWGLAIPIATNIVAWTNSFHHLFREAPALSPVGSSIPLLDSDYGPWFYFPHAILGYLAFGMSFVLLFQYYRLASPIFRRQIVVLFLGSLIPMMIDLLYVGGITPVANFNFVLPAFSAIGIVWAWALFPSSLFDLNPVARSIAVDVMRDEFFVLDMNNRIVDINPAALALIPPCERNVIGRPLHEVGFRYPDLTERFLDQADGQNEIHTEIVMDRPVGKRWCDLRMWPIRDSQAHVTGRLLILRDITEKHEAQAGLESLNAELEERVAQRTAALAEANDRLMDLDRLKDEFISRIGHELRTPLTNIQLYLHLLEKGGPAKRSAYMQTLTTEADQLQELIEKLLKISFLSNDKSPLPLTPVQVNDLVTSLTVGGWVQSGKAVGIDLGVQLAPDLPPALADEAMLEEILCNLIDNALIYAPNSVVTLRTQVAQRQDQSWICIQVRDTGPGLDEEDKAHLFDRFYRGKAAATFATSGMGLGLASSQELVRRMQGDITAESELGHGSLFTLWLRPAPAESAPLVSTPTAPRLAIKPPKGRI